MKKHRLLLACTLTVFCSLALPFAVFSLWDKALVSASHRQAAAESLSADARVNPTACTLYACSHILNIPLGYNSSSESPWTQTYVDAATIERVRNVLHALQDVGLLTDSQLSKAMDACSSPDIWCAATAPGGLTQISCDIVQEKRDDSSEYQGDFVLNLILTHEDCPVFFNYQDNAEDFSSTLDACSLQSYTTLLGLDSFTDWQYPDWAGAVRDFGMAAYSESAQIYLTLNGHAGLTLSASSMTPQNYLDFDQRYTKGDTP